MIVPLFNKALISSYEYTWTANGLKDTASEMQMRPDGSAVTTVIDWDYDSLNRLVTESYDSSDDSLDYEATYTTDLVGNRLEKSVNNDTDPEADEVITYVFDDNDRLQSESKTVEGVETLLITYEYGQDGTSTSRTGKTVENVPESRTAEDTQYEYDLRGRLSEVAVTAYDENGDTESVVTHSHEYDDSGFRIVTVETVDSDGDGDIDTTVTTTCLPNPINHTGHTQVIEETVDDGVEVKTKTYVIGDEVLAQADTDNGVLFLVKDGHGSTRQVVDVAGEVVQGYAYDAYGNAVGFDPSVALTTLLYSGEHYDPATGLQYLRARWYDPASGRFTRSDTFEGYLSVPQSLHKYTYCHNDPVNGVDPSGEASAFISYIGTYIRNQFPKNSMDTIMYTSGMIFGMGARQLYDHWAVSALAMEGQIFSSLIRYICRLFVIFNG